MTKLRTHADHLTGSLQVPGDKSISHRAIMLGSIAEGRTRVSDWLRAEDCLSTLAIMRALGVSINEEESGDLVIEGVGLKGLQAPEKPLDCGNSGTSMRLLAGLLSGQAFDSELVGDASLSKRPMSRITVPLSQMGARIQGQGERNLPPLRIGGGQALHGIEYDMPVASAQVKSAILLAGLQADGETVIHEKAKSRDHTERMLDRFGVHLDVDGLTIRLQGGQTLYGQDVRVPADISSAAFFIVAGLVLPKADITLTHVGINPTRAGILRVVEEMGGRVEVDASEDGLSADLHVQTSELRATEIGGAIIPSLIDELPVIALLATQAQGRTVIRDAGELRVKETDRIEATVSQLQAMGARIEGRPDGMVIDGPTPLHAARLKSYGDHRIGMMLVIAALLVQEGQVEIDDLDCVAISYPNFTDQLETLLD